MLKKFEKIGLVAAACTLLGVSATEAAVTLTFSQVGNNVTASWSGSYFLPLTSFDIGVSAGAGLGSGTLYGSQTGGLVKAADFNGSGPLSINSDGSYVGDPFGIAEGSLFWPIGVSGETTYFPSGTMTFLGKDLTQMGVASFKNTLAYTGDNSVGGNREIRFNTAVIPEPSSLVLLGLGALGFTTRRQRKQEA